MTSKIEFLSCFLSLGLTLALSNCTAKSMSSEKRSIIEYHFDKDVPPLKTIEILDSSLTNSLRKSDT